MSKKSTKFVSLLTALIMLAAMMAGCQGTSTEEPVQSDISVEQESVLIQEETQERTEEDIIQEIQSGVVSETPAELSLFVCTPDHIKQYIGQMEELDGFVEAEKATNVHISIQTASNDTLTDRFNLMVASGEWTDLVSNVPSNYGGGISKALSEEFIVDLTDYMENDALDYLEFVSQDDSIYKAVRSDEGCFLAIYQVASEALVDQGWVIRKDYLDQVGLDVPETISQWEEVMTAFRDQLGISDPLLLRPNLESVASAWGVADYQAEAANPMNYATWLYNEEGTVKSVFLEDGYRQFLETLSSWYDRGLVNRDFVSRNNERDSAYVSVYLSGQAGIFYCNNLSNLDVGNFEGENVEIVPMPYPVVNEADINQFGAKRERIRSNSISVSSACEDVELALRWLNFWFTDQGTEIANYGIQGKSWERNDDGSWSYTDLVLNNPDGMSQFEARSYYSLADSVPTKLDPTRETTEYGEAEWACIELWANTSTAAYRISSAIALNDEESEIYDSHSTDIETYAMENLMKFVVGEQSLEEKYDEFQNTCRSLGAEECVAAYQGAIDRFNSR